MDDETTPTCPHCKIWISFYPCYCSSPLWSPSQGSGICSCTTITSIFSISICDTLCYPYLATCVFFLTKFFRLLLLFAFAVSWFLFLSHTLFPSLHFFISFFLFPRSRFALAFAFALSSRSGLHSHFLALFFFPLSVSIHSSFSLSLPPPLTPSLAFPTNMFFLFRCPSLMLNHFSRLL